MADTADMAPNRSVPARKTSSNGTRPATRSRSRRREDNLEDQIERLQTDLKAIAATITTMAETQVSDTRKAAKKEVDNLVRSGQETVDEIQDEFGHMEKQIKDTIRAKPLTAMAGAIAIGFCLAILAR